MPNDVKTYHEYCIFKDYSQSTPIKQKTKTGVSGENVPLTCTSCNNPFAHRIFKINCYIKLSKVNELYSHYMISVPLHKNLERVSAMLAP